MLTTETPLSEMPGADIMRAAIDWHVRQDALTVQQWDSFVAWLEADPAHATAFDIVSRDDAERIDALRAAAPPQAANDDAPVRHWRGWAIGGGAAAASVAAALLVFVSSPQAAAPYEVATTSAARTIALETGTSVTIAPASRIILDRKNPRLAKLESGTVLFNVRHDADRPFEVAFGNHVARDLGTVFEISTAREGSEISVAQGSVLVDPNGMATRLGAGDRLKMTSDTAIHSRIVADQIGAWRSGMISFADVPMSDAVATLSRATGTRIHLDPSLQGRHFTGLIRITGSPARDIPHFAALTGAVGTRDGDQWVIAPGGAAQ